MRRVMIKNVVLNWDNTRKEGVYGGYSIQIEFDGDRYEEFFQLGRAKLHNGKWVMNLRSQRPIKVLDCKVKELSNEMRINNGSIGNLMLAVPDEPIYFKGQEIRKGIPMIVQVVDYFTEDF